jgi:acetyltransferase
MADEKFDASADLLGFEAHHPLEPFFKPRAVAVIGATERAGSVGRTVLWNLISSPFGGTVYPVNEKRSNVLGVRAWPSVQALPEPIDLALVVTPAAGVPGVIRDCAAAGVKGAIVISAGFREVGEAGEKLEQEILAAARPARMRVLGPNCLGMMVPPTGLNATFAGAMAKSGSVAFLSQSGALQTAILDWSLQENVGFSAFASLGSMLDIGWGDLIDYLGSDPKTRSILIYMESIGDARGFLSAAREVALRKPIIVIKGGRTAPAAAAALSHTGSLAGSDEALSAAFRRAGVLRVDSIADLFYMADALAKQPRPSGGRLGIVTNAGGPGVLACDALVTGKGEPSALSPETNEKLAKLLPAGWSRQNPVDILGDADPERYAKALEAVGSDKDVDGLLVILTPQDRTDPTATAKRLQEYARKWPSKPVLASWMGAGEVAAGRRLLSEAGIPSFFYPDTAARIFNYMWRYSYNLRGIYETPLLADEDPARHEAARSVIQAARAAGRTVLDELDSKRVLAAYGIPVVETRLARTPDEAVHEAEAIGFPVVVKLHSGQVTHKSEVDGVRLDLRSAREVRAAFESIRERLEELGRLSAFEGVTVQPLVRRGGVELIVGSAIDPQLGPVVLFGAGGVLVEAWQDRSLALPPLTTTLARRMMEQTRIYPLLAGQRGRPAVDVEGLEKLLARFSQLVVEQREISEIEMNPLLVSGERITALDARVVLHGPEISEEKLPRPAVKPYPTRYQGTARLKNGSVLHVRPIRPEDEPRMVEFHRTLSEQSLYMRFSSVMKLDVRVAHERLSRLCFLDFDREMALIAEERGEGGAQGPVLAVARLNKLPGTGDAEFALLVSDKLQGQGLGRDLLQRLFTVGSDWGLDNIVAEILPENMPMRRLCRALGFVFGPRGSTWARKDMKAPPPPPEPQSPHEPAH